MNSREDKYRVLGDIQMYQAAGEEERKKKVLSYLNSLAQRGGDALIDADGTAVLFALDVTGDERFRKAAEAKAGRGTEDFAELPFYTAFDTRYQRKGHYEAVISRFREREGFSDDELVTAIDTLEQMSQEIYEYYRELSDIFKREVKKRLETEKEGERSKAFAYCVLKACARNVLQREKYQDIGTAVWKEAGMGAACEGMDAMLQAQYLILNKERGLPA